MNGDSDFNDLMVVEKGSGNRATGHIVGDYNDVDVSQQGTSNWVGTGAGWNAKDGVVISGDYNTTSISQQGPAHMSTVMQTGDMNTSTITQTP